MASISYNDVLYEGTAVEGSHPRRLAALARLFGVPAPPVATARVLEFGSAIGENLVPMAAALPNARFLGLDNADRQVERARAFARRLRLTNIEFEARDILAVPETLAPFDYIIAHGVYSWVSEPVRLRMLQLCGRLLAPGGVAFVSYNCYPGWYLRQPLRELMLFATRQLNVPPGQLIDHARAMAEIVVRTALDIEDRLPGGPLYARVLARELDIIADRPDDYIAHEHLEPVNTPVYFTEFIAQAEAAGLDYLADALVQRMVMPGLEPAVTAEFEQLAPDRVEREQLLDFIHGRTFRESLLVRAGTPIDREPSPGALRGLALRLLGEFIAPGEDRYDPGLPKVRHPGGILALRDPDLLEAIRLLDAARPRAVPAEDLAAHIDPRRFWDRTAPKLLRLFWLGAIRLEAEPAAPVAAPGPFPRAFAPARDQAARDGIPVSMLHTVEDVPPLALRLLPFLDGTRTIDDLARVVLEQLSPQAEDEAIRAAGLSHATARVAVAAALQWLARHAYLES